MNETNIVVNAPIKPTTNPKLGTETERIAAPITRKIRINSDLVDMASKSESCAASERAFCDPSLDVLRRRTPGGLSPEEASDSAEEQFGRCSVVTAVCGSLTLEAAARAVTIEPRASILALMPSS